jgi:hypothetical protein
MQCPYAGGDAVYYARAMLAQISAPQFYDDVQLCPELDDYSDRSLVVNPPSDTTNLKTANVNEFVILFPNPAKQLINLAYRAETVGEVDFEIFDALGEEVLKDTPGIGQTSRQYSTNNISNGVYYWILKDSERIIKTGKVVIIK